MKTRSLKQKCSSALMLIAALTVAFSSVSAQEPEPNGATAHGRQTLHGTWRVTRTAVNCITGQDIFSFPRIVTFNQGGTYTGYGVPPGSDPGQGTEYGVWQREPGSQNYSDRVVVYSYTAEGDFDGRVEATDHDTSHQRRQLRLVAPQSSSSMPTAI